MEAVRELVQQKYGAAARQVREGLPKPSCCGAGSSCGCGTDPITSDLYGPEAASLPQEALLASLGCGNPTALIELRAGETVLDLGSGGGIDVLLSAQTCRTDRLRLRPGHDRRHARPRAREPRAGRRHERRVPQGRDREDTAAGRVRGRHHFQLRNQPVRRQAPVLREAFRVLKPGGRFAVSDVVVRGDVPAEIRRSAELWVGCVAGALEESDYRRLLTDAGFSSVEIDPWRIYHVNDAREFLADTGLDVDAFAAQVEDKFASAFVRATKPEACCGPDCCGRS